MLFFIPRSAHTRNLFISSKDSQCCYCTQIGHQTILVKRRILICICYGDCRKVGSFISLTFFSSSLQLLQFTKYPFSPGNRFTHSQPHPPPLHSRTFQGCINIQGPEKVYAAARHFRQDEKLTSANIIQTSQRKFPLFTLLGLKQKCEMFARIPFSQVLLNIFPHECLILYGKAIGSISV